MNENKKRIIIAVAAVTVGVGLYIGGQATVRHAQAAKQTELDTYRAEQQAQLEAAKKAELEAAAKAAEITLAPISSNSITTTTSPTQGGSQETPRPIPAATVTTEPDGSITIIPDFEAQAGAATQLQKPGEKIDANMGGAGGDLPLGKDGAYHGDHPATPAPKATVTPIQGSDQETPKPTSSPESSTKPSEATQKPSVSQRPTFPASTPTATTEPPTASQKPNGDDSGNGNEPEVTPKPSQGQDQGGSDTPPNRQGVYDGERTSDGKWEWWGLGINEWVAIGGSDGGISGQLTGGGEGGLSGNKVGNM